MATITVKDLEIKTIIGINPEEREREQELKITYSYDVDITKPGITDNIEDCVNYRTINKTIITLVKKSQYFTLEKLTIEILNTLTAIKSIKRASVTVSKPQALRYTSDTSVTEYSENLQ